MTSASVKRLGHVVVAAYGEASESVLGSVL